MKSILPHLLGPLLALLAPAACSWAQAPASANQAAGPDQVLQAAMAALQRYDTVTARLRYRASLFGESLSGTGVYAQGPVRYNLVRLQLTLQHGDATSALVQVCDGKHLWTHRELLGEQKVTRLDAERVLEALQGAAPAAASPQALALGGLPRWLQGLALSFEFTSMQDSELGSLPMRVLRGQWRPKKLGRLLPAQKAALEAGGPLNVNDLPEHVPDHVLVYLGRDDLFPYRLEFRKSASEESPRDRALVTVELFDIQANNPIDTRQFVYDPGDAEVIDETDAFLEARGW